MSAPLGRDGVLVEACIYDSLDWRQFGRLSVRGAVQLPNRDRSNAEKGHALQAVALMQQGRGIELSSPLALSAARLSIEHRLSMADSMVLASAKAHGATLWTQEAGLTRRCERRG